MAIEGRKGASSILVGGGHEGGVLRQAVAAAVKGGIDHLVGIAVAQPVATWVEAMQDAGPASATLICALDGAEPTTTERTDDIEIRSVRGDSLGDLGISVVDAIAEADPTRPGVVLDSVGALTEDPGKRFKFLSLIGQRVSVDDGTFVALEGSTPLPDHERNTLSTVFDDIRDGD